MPKAKRDDGAKLFMGELTKTDNAGKNSPGPVYMFSDNVKYDQAPGWSLGTEVRVGEDKPKYDFYENALFLDIQLKLISQEKLEFSLLKLELNLDSKETTWSIIQDHNIIQKKNQFIIKVKNSHSDGEEEELFKIRLQRQEVLDLEDMYQRLALSHLTNKTSLDGLYLKQVAQRMKD